MHVALLKKIPVQQKKQALTEKKKLPTSPKVKKSRGRPKLYRDLHDRGTPELQEKRQILIENGEQPKLAPSQDISQSLRLLYYCKAITEPQRSAGCSYKLLWESVQRFLGNQPLRCSSLTFLGQTKCAYSPWLRPCDLPEKKEYLFRQWVQVQNLLARGDKSIQQAVYRIVIQNQITPEMIEEDVSPPPFILCQLKTGLDLLQKYFHSGIKK